MKDNVRTDEYPLWIEYLESTDSQKGTFEQYKKRELKKQNRKLNESRREENNVFYETEFVLEGYTTPIKAELKAAGCVWIPIIRKWSAPNKQTHQEFQTRLDVIYQEKYGVTMSTITSTETAIARTKRSK